MAVLSSYIYLYETQRIDSICAEKFRVQLENFGVDAGRIVQITDTSYLERDLLKTDSSVLVVPGALNSFSVAEEICKNQLASRIRKAVERGWSYLGVCAGGNIAAYDMSIDMPAARFSGYASEIGVSFLNLLPVHAVIPVYPIEIPNSLGGSNGRIISVQTLGGEVFKTYWNEGSSFRILEATAKPEVSYTEISSETFAVVSGNYGRGSVVSMGIHPELTEDSEYQDTENRQRFVKKIFQFSHIF